MIFKRASAFIGRIQEFGIFHFTECRVSIRDTKFGYFPDRTLSIGMDAVWSPRVAY